MTDMQFRATYTGAMDEEARFTYTPLSSARRRSKLTPLRRRDVVDDATAQTSMESVEMSSSEQLEQACEALDSEITTLQDDGLGLGDGDESDDLVSRMALLADKVTKRRLERVAVVSARLEATEALQARVDAARDAAQPEVSKAERRNRLADLKTEHSELIAAILASTEETKSLSLQRDRMAAQCMALKVEFEKTRKSDDSKLSFYAYLTKLMMDVTSTRILPSEDGRLRGFVMKQNLHDVVNFELEPDTPPYQVVDTMWRNVLQ